MTPFACPQCRGTVFFENSQCGRCGTGLAFDVSAGAMRACPDLDPMRSGAVACLNRGTEAACNWLVDDAGQGWTLCRSCRLTRTIPDLATPGHGRRWQRIEQAKRRLLHGLHGIGLTPTPRRQPVPGATDDPRGLAFDLLARMPDGQPLVTGHLHGVITLDIAEADDDHREAQRVRFGEAHRTLLGHLRHEVAHHLQHRWIAGDASLAERCRAVFGDERQDYAQALARHHAEGPPADWASGYISAYASAHPWEDWAETCAHWLLIVDAVQTAGAWGLRLDGPAGADVRMPPGPPAELPAERLVLDHWLPVAQALNAMHRSIGLGDSYPFLMPPAVVAKLEAVRTLLRVARDVTEPPVGTGPAASPAAPQALPA